MYGIAPKIPVTIAGSQGFATTQTLKENTQQNLTNLILTSPGERIMDVEFGVGVRNYLFQNFNEIDLETRLYEQVDSYMPFVTIENLDLNRDPDHGVLSLSITYSVSNVLSDQTLSLTIDPKLTS